MARPKLALNDSKRRTLLKALRYRGVIREVSSSMSKDYSHVRRVALTERRSKKIEAALISAVQRFERQLKETAA